MRKVSNTSVLFDSRGIVTTIYEDPITRFKPEGDARLCEPEDARCVDGEWWDGWVEFLDEPGQFYCRRVYLCEGGAA